LIFEGLYSDNLHIWFKSLVEAKIEYGDGADKILPIILRDLLLAKCEANRSEGKKILNDFLSNKYLFTIFRRLVLLCIDKYWNYYADFLDKFLKLIPSILDEPELEIELQDIFRHHNKEFNDCIKSMIKEYINDVPLFYTARGEKDSAYWKYIWLSPLRDNPDFSPLYEKVKKIYNPQDDRPLLNPDGLLFKEVLLDQYLLSLLKKYYKNPLANW
jgi:hypothetical protein